MPGSILNIRRSNTVFEGFSLLMNGILYGYEVSAYSKHYKNLVRQPSHKNTGR